MTEFLYHTGTNADNWDDQLNACDCVRRAVTAVPGLPLRGRPSSSDVVRKFSIAIPGMCGLVLRAAKQFIKRLYLNRK